MAVNGNRQPVRTTTGRRAANAQASALAAMAPLAPEDFVAIYNANCDMALQYAQAAIAAASRFQALEVQRGEQALALAGKVLDALAEKDSASAVAVRSDVAQEAFREAVAYWERLFAVSADARRELLQILDRQCRVNGLPEGLPYAELLDVAGQARPASRARH